MNGVLRRRVRHASSLQERLNEAATRLRDRAEALSPGLEQDALSKKADELEAATKMDQWLRTPQSR